MLSILVQIALALAGDHQPPPVLTWDEARVEHLWNRAGFGALAEEIKRGLELGPEALVEELLTPRAPAPEEAFFVEALVPDRQRLKELGPRARRDLVNRLKTKNREQQRAYLAAWVERMIEGRDPLVERMTLFWHGLFTSQISKVEFSSEMIAQNQLLRRHALGNYGELLRAMLRDPALLVYLDNDQSAASHPNENLARELLELFALGEGNYTEADVAAAARALTGHGVERGRGYRFDPERHDYASKTLLGVSGPLDLDDVVDAILEKRQCARYIAERLITYFEGAPPARERLERYADLLYRGDYEVAPLLRALFLDPDFYRSEVIGARVLSPIDFAVGSVRRLGIRPPPTALVQGAALLGEELFEPPNVRGWEGGESWITTSALIDRGNFVGLLLGVISLEDLLRVEAPEEEMLAAERVSAAEIESDVERLADDGAESEMMSLAMMADDESEPAMSGARAPRSPLLRVVRVLESSDYTPRIHLAARLAQRELHGDGEIIAALLDELLGIEAPKETQRTLVRELRALRVAAGIERGALLEAGEEAERILRRMAHRILSLPEAQLG